MQAKAREQGVPEVGMPQPEGSPGDRLMEQLGYRVRWHSWVLRLPEGAVVPERPLPDGYTLRAATEEEHPQVHDVQEDAFLEWSVRERDTFEEWQAGTVLRPGFEPWHLRVVLDPAGAVVAMAFLVMFPREDGQLEAYVDRLATRGDQRGRGLAQALLVDAFGIAAEHGAVGNSLSTDSRTGALGLYERVGMVVTQTWVNRAIAV
jgi:GNAT superfamily N-acetyltransferase